MECRIYAEDAAHDFRPSIGTIEHYVPPVGPGIRVDSGVTKGSEVTPHYDAMLGKLIVSGRTREESLEKMTWALRRYVILGVTTNIEFLQDLIDHPEFQAGRLHTDFLKEHPIAIRGTGDVPHEALIAATAAIAGRRPKTHRASFDGTGLTEYADTGPWH